MLHRLIPLALVAALAGCQTPTTGSTSVPSTSSEQVTLSGNAAYRERIALPPDARLTVRISDVSRMDVAAPVIAETTVASEGRQVPLPFSLSYDRAKIDPRGRYSVSARITDAAGQLLWITDTHTDLPAPGQSVNLTLVQAAR